MEMVLVALLDDLWHGQDGGYASILALLDLSAFHTIVLFFWTSTEKWG